MQVDNTTLVSCFLDQSQSQVLTVTDMTSIGMWGFLSSFLLCDYLFQ